MTKTYSSALVKVVVTTCLLALAHILCAQSIETTTFSGTYQNATTAQILKDIESKTGIRFFYRPEELPSRRISVNFSTLPLNQTLDQVLEGSPLAYLEYRNGQVAIMNAQVVNQVYTVNYYQALARSRDEPREPPRTRQQSINLGSVKSMSPSGRATLQGSVLNAEDNEPIIGANIIFTGLDGGTITDENGDFTFDLPVGSHEMIIQYVGFDDLIKKVNIYEDGKTRLQMESAAVNLDAVTVTAQAADASVENVQIGVTTLDIKNIKKIPAFLGEADVVKNLLLNPGISSIGEGATGFNVRGGNVDQNLILQDEGFFFNSSHALGFFSTFNTDLINSVQLFKGNIPATYGGRLASAMEVEMRNGDFERFRMKGGLGPVSSRIALEGPLVKNKVSILGGFRSSYSDWILKQVKVLEVNRSSSFFYDGNLRLTIKPSEKSTVILAGYASEDEFVYNAEFGFDYSTLMGQLIYKQIFTDNLFNKFSVTGSQYESAQTDLEGVDASQVNTGVSYLRVKEHLTYTPRRDWQIDAGFSSVYYQVDPGKQAPFGDESEILSDGLDSEQGLESALFANFEATLTPAFIFSAGIRGVFYQFLGPFTEYQYSNPDRPTETTITGTQDYGSGENIASYSNFEPRVSMRYRFSENTSVKLGYSRTSQYINQIFNTDSPTPNSQWQLSNNYLLPQKSHNSSVGLFRNFEENNWETSLELYYRYIDQLYDFRDFAQLIVNEHIETELLAGIGRSYGAELSIKKKKGELNGWLSYTLSRSERQIEGINRDDWYPSNFDKTHDVSLVMNYQPNRRNTLTINFSYFTGRPTTPPVGNYRTSNGLIVPIYSERNQFRIPDYHRLDVAYTLGKGYKKDKKIQTSWTISVYNVYARRNAFSVFFTQAAFRQAQANKLAVLGSTIPSLTFNIEIL